MTRKEFALCMAYPTAAMGKELSDEATEVYLELLGDLPFEVLLRACKQVCLEHKYATFPSVAEIREAAIAIMSGSAATMPAQTAWAIAWRAAGQIDPDIRGEYVVMRNGQREVYPSMTDYALRDVPPHIIKAMQTFGLARLVAGAEPMGVMQAQFCSTYSALQLTERREALLPASLRAEIDRIGKGQPPLRIVQEVAEELAV